MTGPNINDAPSYWTDEADAILRRCRNEGRSNADTVSEIADIAHIRMTIEQVKWRAKKLGLPKAPALYTTWKPHEVDRLRELIGEGRTMSAISRILTVELGRLLSRDSVNGAAIRHKIVRHGKPGQPVNTPVNRSERPRAWPVSTIGELPPEKQRTGCGYIIGEVFEFGEGPWRYCNTAIHNGGYCAEHAAICLIPAPPLNDNLT